jgi:hypothetical protein
MAVSSLRQRETSAASRVTLAAQTMIRRLTGCGFPHMRGVILPHGKHDGTVPYDDVPRRGL